MKVGSTAVHKVSISVTPLKGVLSVARESRIIGNTAIVNCQLSVSCGCVCWPIVDNEIFTLSGRHYDMLLWICGGNTFFNFKSAPFCLPQQVNIHGIRFLVDCLTGTVRRCALHM